MAWSQVLEYAGMTLQAVAALAAVGQAALFGLDGRRTVGSRRRRDRLVAWSERKADQGVRYVRWSVRESRGRSIGEATVWIGGFLAVMVAWCLLAVAVGWVARVALLDGRDPAGAGMPLWLVLATIVAGTTLAGAVAWAGALAAFRVVAWLAADVNRALRTVVLVFSVGALLELGGKTIAGLS
jgi:hypothetical protein